MLFEIITLRVANWQRDICGWQLVCFPRDTKRGKSPICKTQRCDCPLADEGAERRNMLKLVINKGLSGVTFPEDWLDLMTAPFSSEGQDGLFRVGDRCWRIGYRGSNGVVVPFAKEIPVPEGKTWSTDPTVLPGHRGPQEIVAFGHGKLIKLA